MSKLRSCVLLAFSAVASVGMLDAAVAADLQPTAPKMVLHFKAEDLNTEEGIKKVFLQIRHAAEDVCPNVRTGTYLLSQSALNCRQAAIASAVDAIHNKRLVELATAASKSV